MDFLSRAQGLTASMMSGLLHIAAIGEPQTQRMCGGFSAHSPGLSIVCAASVTNKFSQSL